MNQAVDQGDLAVNYHMLNFLNPPVVLRDYSTRAAAALLCVAKEGGTQPGLYLNYHSALFSPDNQPAEGGSADLTNEQLAACDLVGRSAAAAPCISSGQNVQPRQLRRPTTSSATLSAATGGRSPPRPSSMTAHRSAAHRRLAGRLLGQVWPAMLRRAGGRRFD